MFATIALVIVYFYGAGSPPQVYSKAVSGPVECAQVVAQAKALALPKEDVRDVQGGCLTIALPQPRNKT